MFCRVHRHQKWYWIVPGVSACAVFLATVAGLYQDLFRFLPPFKSKLEVSSTEIELRSFGHLSDDLVQVESLVRVRLANHGGREGWIESCRAVPRGSTPPPGPTTCTPDDTPIQPGESAIRTASFVTTLSMAPDVFLTPNVILEDALTHL